MLSPLLFVLFFSVQVNAATNRPPAANPQSVNTNEDTALNISLTGSDYEGAALSYSIVTNPNKGSLTCTDSQCRYTPTANVNGSDSFTFRVYDGSLYSRNARVSITINKVNDAPTASDYSSTSTEDVTATIRPSTGDVDGDARTLVILSQPASSLGSVYVSGSTIIFTPVANANGVGSFTYAANDGQINSAPATITLDVVAVNDAPTAISQTVQTNEDASVTIPLEVNDIDGDALTTTIGYASTNGSLSVSGTTVMYTPNSNFAGSDSFTYRVSDASASSSVTTVYINVLPVNDAPVVSADRTTLSVGAGESAIVTLSGSDTEGSDLTYSIETAPIYGTVKIYGSNLVYTANKGVSGADSLSFVSKDSEGLASSPALLTVNVLPIDTVVPISASYLEPVPGVSAQVSADKKVISLASSNSCYDFIATPLIVPVQLQNGEIVEAVTGTLFSKCLNRAVVENYTFLIFTHDGTVWQFSAEKNLNLKLNAKATGYFDHLRGVLWFPLASTGAEDPDESTGGMVAYDSSAEYINTHAGRVIDTAILSVDGIFPLVTSNEFTTSCLTGHKIWADYCGVFAFLSDQSRKIIDRAFYVDNSFEAWYTGAGTRTIVEDQSGNVSKDYLVIGTGPGGSNGDSATTGGGCSVFLFDKKELMDSVYNSSFASFNLFKNVYDPGDAGCINVSAGESNSILAGSAIQGEMTPGFNPNTKMPTTWVKALEPDVLGSADARISQLDWNLSLDGDASLVCETFVNAGEKRNPFNGVSTGIVIDNQGNAYTNADYYNEQGVLHTSIMAINPIDCSTTSLMDYVSVAVGYSFSGVTLAKDTNGALNVLAALGGNLYIHNRETTQTVVYSLGSSSSDNISAAPVIDKYGRVIVISRAHVVTIFDNLKNGAGENLTLSYDNLFWPRFRKDNSGSATVKIVQ